MLNKSHQEIVKVDQIVRKRKERGTASSGCFANNRTKCEGDDLCEWAPTPYLGKLFASFGTCKDVNVLKLYLKAACSPEYLKGHPELYKKEIKKISQRFGYVLADFEETAWTNLTRATVCSKVSRDIETATREIGSGKDLTKIRKGLGFEDNEEFENLILHATYLAQRDGIFRVIDVLRQNYKLSAVIIFSLVFLIYTILDQRNAYADKRIEKYSTGLGFPTPEIKTNLSFNRNSVIDSLAPSFLNFTSGDISVINENVIEVSATETHDCDYSTTGEKRGGEILVRRLEKL